MPSVRTGAKDHARLVSRPNGSFNLRHARIPFHSLDLDMYKHMQYLMNKEPSRAVPS
jgi:hypothetical protein